VDKGLRATRTVVGSASVSASVLQPFNPPSTFLEGHFQMSKQAPTCLDCYFNRHGLCALALAQPCPTFRAAGQRLEPPVQPPLVARGALATLVAAGAAYAS
jgi:hypothetical protein